MIQSQHICANQGTSHVFNLMLKPTPIKEKFEIVIEAYLNAENAG